MRAYKYRLYPDNKQKNFLEQHFGSKRFVWNALVANFNNYETEDYIEGLNEKTLKEEHTWLKDRISYVLQQARIDFQNTCKQFFNKKRKKRLGKMNFKKKGKARDSFRIPASSMNVKSFEDIKDGIKLPKYNKRIKIKIDRGFTGKPLSLTFSKDSVGDYYVSIIVDEEPTHKEKTGKVVGIDLGLKELVVTNDNKKVINPHWFRESQSKLKRLQQHLSRKVKGSNNFKKNKKKIAKLHRKIVRQREWFLHNVSSYFVNTYDYIFIEDLDVSGMQKNRKLSKSIQDVSLNKLVEFLSYKCEFYEKELYKIDRFFSSSKTCSKCGYIVEKMPLYVRNWQCPKCKTEHNRDVNAARNILIEGMRKVFKINNLSAELLDYSCGEDMRLDSNFFLNQANLCEAISSVNSL